MLIRRRPVVLLPVLGLALLISAEATAWKGAAAASVVTISEVREKGEMGDRVTIEGTVRRVKQGRLFEVSDDTGQMILLIPEHVRREAGTPKSNERIRVSGAVDREKLDKKIYGIRVQSLELLGPDNSARGEAAATMPPAPSPVPARVEGSGEASGAGTGSASIIQPQAGPEWVDRLRSARQRYIAAAQESREAGTALARAVREAGSLQDADPDVVQREQDARDEFQRANSAVRKTVNQAREAGVSEDILRLYEEANRNQLR